MGTWQARNRTSKGFELVCGFYETDNAVYGNCDDSSGTIGDSYKHNAHNLLIQFGKQCEELRIAAHQAIGKKTNREKIARILRKRLFASPSAATLFKLDEYLEASECESVVAELVSGYANDKELNPSFLDFALSELDVEIAESYLLERSDQIDGERYYALAPLAKLFVEKKSPLAATLILRALADSILQRSVSKNYRIAVGYIKRAAKLALEISDWQTHIDHDAYLKTLHTNHAHKSAFWSKME